MNILDLFIIIFCIAAFFRGLEIGFVRQFFSTAGFLGGLWLGIVLQPHLVSLVHTDLSRSVLTLVVILGSGMLFLAIGEYVGYVIKRKLMKNAINPVDYALGSVIAIVSILIVVWLCANLFASLPYPGLQRTIGQSVIIRQLNQRLPPAPQLVDNIGRLIDPNGFPDVFAGIEPPPSQTVDQPGLVEFKAAIAATETSVVKIQGPGCGGVVEGSGFVVGTNLVATNAHVIAGIDQILVQDENGTHRAVPIWFDPRLDFAVLRVADLAGKPLRMITIDPPHGTPAAVLGYPGGGSLKADSAAVLNKFTALGHDIYGSGRTERVVYELQADIIPGNSGGPVIDKQGRVIGVVFAESSTYENIGYALDTEQVRSDLQTAKSENRLRDTGSCAE